MSETPSTIERIEIITYSKTRHWSEDGHRALCSSIIWGDPVKEWIGRSRRDGFGRTRTEAEWVTEIEGMKQCSRCAEAKPFTGVDRNTLEPTGLRTPPVLAATSPDGPRRLFWAFGVEGNQRWISEDGTVYAWANLIDPKRAKGKDLKR